MELLSVYIMFSLNFSNLNTWNFLSWEKCYKNIFRIQKRILKSILVGDVKSALKMQKLLIKSYSARLLAIRSVTQISLKKKVSGVDGKLSLTYAERVNMSNFLFYNSFNWKPQKLRKMKFNLQDSNLETVILDIPTISDRIWYTLIGFAIRSSNQYLFSGRSFFLPEISSIHEFQQLLFLNLNSFSCGIQKRILIVEFKKLYEFFDVNKLLRKLIAPRGVKVGIFRSIKLGLRPSFSENLDDINYLSNFLADMLFYGIESLHDSFRCGHLLLLILKPFDSEKVIIKKIKNFLMDLGLIDVFVKINIYSSFTGFDFLYWHFKVNLNGFLSCFPSFDSYRSFLKRIKFIINNSNYGAKIKAVKISPIIRNWKNYNKFCNSKHYRVSLFYIKKRAFRVFSKESKQDFYSVSKLLQKSFNSNVLIEENLESNFSYFGHIFLKSESLSKNFNISCSNIKGHFCIHCGMNLV